MVKDGTLIRTFAAGLLKRAKKAGEAVPLRLFLRFGRRPARLVDAAIAAPAGISRP